MTTIEPTPEAVEALAKIGGKHRYADVLGDYEIEPYRKYFGCSCGWKQDIGGMSGYWSWREAHELHVARAVLAEGYVKYEPEPELLCWCGSATKEWFERDVCATDGNHMVRHEGETYFPESRRGDLV